MAKICLDAGHYGDYNRSPAVPEYYESRMNWKLHLLLKGELEKKGFQVVTTRPDPEKDLALVERGKASKGCDIFLSLHSNAVGSRVEENVDYVVAHCTIDGRADKLGLSLAEAVAEQMGTAQKPRIGHKEGSRGDWYGVLRGAACVGVPGIILEHSFHTCTRSTRWLLQDENLEKLAAAEAAVIAGHFGAAAQPEGTPGEARWYRIRKSWEDADSQVGAYREFANARVACPEGYTVYDWNGEAVYTVPAKTYTLTLPVLYRGRKGAAVKALQTLLMGRGYSCGSAGADGSFGPDTEKAVKAYQQGCEITATGTVDMDTMRRLLGV